MTAIPSRAFSGHRVPTGTAWLTAGRQDGLRWPKELQDGIQRAAREAVLAQRKLAVDEEEVARKAIEAAGGEVLELPPAARAEFVKAVKPLHDEARKRFGEEGFALLRAS